MLRILTNLSDHEITLDDLNGKVVQVGESFDAYTFGEANLKSSSSVTLALLNKLISVSDGAITFTGQDGVNLIQGVATQYTVDGKPITTSSDRPKDTYRHFTGAGDDVSGGIVGGGQQVIFDVPPGQTSAIDIKFIDNVFIRDGKCVYVNGDMGSHLHVDVIVPAGTPLPSATHTGNVDYVAGSFVANTTSTGAYQTYPVEIKLNRFVNHCHLMLSQGEIEVTSPEPFQLYNPWFLRFTMFNNHPTANLQMTMLLGLFRKLTS